MRTAFDCTECKQHIVYEREGDCGGTGYATRTDDGGQEGKVCYPCCGKIDRADMIEHGRTVLYLTGGKVSNWPGSLSFNVGTIKTGHHNMAGKRYDVWFAGPDGKIWHGVQYGDNTQICHCRRTKL